MKISYRVIGLLCGLSLLGVNGCGSSSPSAAATAAAAETFSSYLALGLALSSPAAKSTTTLVSTQSADAEVDSSAPVSEKAAILEDLAKGTSAAACSFALPNLGSLGARANCYGPNVSFTSHPDGSPTAGSLPGGDLGFWSNTETSSGEACSVAQLNRITSAASAYVDSSLLLQSASICVLNNAGKSFPAKGESVTFETELGTALSSPANATITTAKVTRNDDSVITFEFEGTTDGTKAFSVSIIHTATSDSKVYSGTMWGTFTTGQKDSFSVDYSRATDTLKARMVAGSWTTATTDATIFNADHRVNTGGTFQGNMNHAILNYDVAKKTGVMSYAWQAGSGDSNTRVMNIYVSGADGSRSGCGFYGFGSKFTSDFADNTNTIDRMICNWAGPGNSHSGLTSRAQKQCFTESSGKFVLDTSAASKNSVLYWPTNSCDKGGIALTPTQEGETGSTNGLANLTSDTDYTNYTAPTAP